MAWKCTETLQNVVTTQYVVVDLYSCFMFIHLKKCQGFLIQSSVILGSNMRLNRDLPLDLQAVRQKGVSFAEFIPQWVFLQQPRVFPHCL
jgi:hypothetical protein